MLIQRIGRALRVHESKAAPVVFDIVDRGVGVLDYQARTRRRIFEHSFATSLRGIAA